MTTNLPKPGDIVTVDYASRTGAVLTVSGLVCDGRYPHMYLTIAGLDIPWDKVRRVDGRIVRVGCGWCDRCRMDAHVPTGRGWSNCGRSGKD